MTNFRKVSWFRFSVIVLLSLCTSQIYFYADERLTAGEAFITIMQALIAGLSYLQCPESVRNNARKSNSKL